jgi:hypothetical protein
MQNSLLPQVNDFDLVVSIAGTDCCELGVTTDGNRLDVTADYKKLKISSKKGFT